MGKEKPETKNLPVGKRGFDRTQVDRESRTFESKLAFVVVLGDIARSPRMRLHAESFSREGYFVHIIATRGTSVVPESLSQDPSVSLSYVPETPELISELPRSIRYLFKITWQLIGLSLILLWTTFLRAARPDCIIVQNPPSLPTLPVVSFYAKCFRCQLIVDWHNYGYTILQLSSGKDSLFTKLYRWCEFRFGAMGTTHLTVTNAMQKDLERRTGIRAIPYHDRPGSRFKPLSEKERYNALELFSKRFPELRGSAKGGNNLGVLVSSTSWTEDEDFSILLDALEEYNRHALKSTKTVFPKLVVFITGKGPLKAYYENIINKLSLQFVTIYLPWLEHEEYPILLGCADLGVSLHTSSSGLDLPMKVVDMFGCGLPVAAIHFECISELVQDKINGVIFHSSEELAEQIRDWFSPVPNTLNQRKEDCRRNLVNFHRSQWHDNWREKILPILR